MKIVNRTQWCTEDIERVILIALRLAGIENHARERVSITYSKRCNYHGWAYYGHVKPPKHKFVRGPDGYFLRDARGKPKKFPIESFRMKLIVPHPSKVDGMLDMHEFVWLVRHEVGHWQGLSHKQMGEKLRWHDRNHPNPQDFDGLRIGISMDFEEVAEVVPIRKTLERERNIEHAKKMLEKATARRRRYESAVTRSLTIEKKWMQRLNRLERNSLKAARLS